MFNLDRTNPISLIVSSEIAARAWCFIALGAVGYALILPHLLVRELKKNEKVIVISEAGEIIYAENQDWENATRLHSFCAKKATACLVLRNPSGPDDRDLIDRLFTTAAKEKLHDVFKQNEQEFRDKSIHQKGEVLQWVILEKGKMNIEDQKGNPKKADYVVVQVDGQIIKSGEVKGLPFRDDASFRLTLTLVRNDKLLENNFLPLVVADFDYKEQKL